MSFLLLLSSVQFVSCFYLFIFFVLFWLFSSHTFSQYLLTFSNSSCVSGPLQASSQQYLVSSSRAISNESWENKSTDRLLCCNISQYTKFWRPSQHLWLLKRSQQYHIWWYFVIFQYSTLHDFQKYVREHSHCK